MGLALVLAGVVIAPPSTADRGAVGPGAADRHARRPVTQPLVWARDVADPSVVEYNGNYLAVGTGPAISRVRAGGARGPYSELASPLTAYPSWVLPGEIWAPDLAQAADGSWVLYYTALAAGLPAGGRCIGAATAATPSGPFTPYGDVPLACPPRAGYPPASDQLLDRELDLPAGGVIDPSLFTERDGKLYLLYKTQGVPSTIRMVQLTPDGLAVLPGRHSKALLRSHQIVENPTLVHQGSHYVLFTSEGWYGDCDYRTTYRKSRKRWTGWPTRSANLLGPVITGLCGPGGADVVAPSQGGRTRMFFHGWTCFQTNQPCPRTFRRDRDAAWLPTRGMYGVLLDWGDSDSPLVADYLRPR